MNSFGLFEFLLLALASWRLASMLIYETGPFAVFDRLRAAANRLGAGGVFACIWCMSVWVAGAAVLLYHIAPTMLTITAIWLALSAAIVFIDNGIEHD
jgi:hypothetical protein